MCKQRDCSHEDELVVGWMDGHAAWCKTNTVHLDADEFGVFEFSHQSKSVCPLICSSLVGAVCVCGMYVILAKREKNSTESVLYY